jgi:bacteriocin-like protein
MSDPEKTSKSDQEAPKQTPELSENELKEVIGGASDVFVNLGDIKGESTDTGRKDWIDIFSISRPGPEVIK